MSQKDFFQLGAKLIGLYTLVLVVPILLGVLPTAVALVGKNPNAADLFGIHLLPLFAAPILLAAVGFYLLKSRTFGHWIGAKEIDATSDTNLSEYFTVGVKLYGVFLVVSTIPGFLKVLVNFLFLANHTNADVLSEVLGLSTNFIPGLAVIAFGLLLWLRGELLTSWAFPSSEDDD